MKFSDLGLSSELSRAVADLGYEFPTPIQEKSIPVVLMGRDILGSAQTGTGKTAGFSLPMLHKLSSGKPASSNRVRALILTPTRELAAQVEDNVRGFNAFLSLKTAVVFGGVGINPQMKALRSGVDVLIATPGRLLDLFKQRKR